VCVYVCCSLSGSSERVQYFAESIVPYLSFDDFRMHFRMSRTCFEMLARHLATTTEFQFEQSHGGRTPIAVDKALMICLWTLAKPDSYRAIANLFDVPKSTVLLCVRRVCTATIRTCCAQFVKFPKSKQELTSNMQGFANMRGMQNVLGAIDGSHIAIKAPEVEPAAYVNRKGFYSIVLQAVVDSKLMFMDCYAGWPGSVHDARVFKNSPLFNFGAKVCSPNCLILGDAAYPLKSWLLVPYRDNGKLNAVQRNFNFVHAATRCTVERAFALLKGRFRRLKYLDMKHMEDIMNVIMTCCIFHNICLLSDRDTDLFVNADVCDEPDGDMVPVRECNDQDACTARDEIAAMLSNL